MSDRPNRNEQRRARALAAQERITYQQALTCLRHDTPPAVRQAPAPDLRAPQLGEVRCVVVAWRLDDPAVQDDGRFWLTVPEQAVSVLGRPAGAIAPKGQTLACLRARATGDELELLNPVTRERERFSLERWSAADPERTYVIVAFEHFTPPASGTPDPERGATTSPIGGVRTSVKLELSDEAKRIRARQAELQREFRAARDHHDDRRMRELSPQLQLIADELARVAFPHYVRGWTLSSAIREGTNRFVLDWTTGY